MTMMVYANQASPPAPLAPTSARYWRMTFTEVNHPWYACVAEANIREISGVDQPMTGIASASSAYAAAYSADKAFDGATASAWISAKEQAIGGWLQIVLDEPVIGIYLAIRAFNTQPGADQAPKGWKVEYSVDGTTWVLKKTITNQTGWALNETREFAL